MSTKHKQNKKMVCPFKNEMPIVNQSTHSNSTHHPIMSRFKPVKIVKLMLIKEPTSPVSFDRDSSRGVCKFFARPGPIKKYIQKPIRPPLGDKGTNEILFRGSNFWKLLRSYQRDRHFEKHPIGGVSLCVHAGVCYACVHVRVCTGRNGGWTRSPRMMRNEQNHKCPLYAPCDTVAGTQASHDIARRYL